MNQYFQRRNDTVKTCENDKFIKRVTLVDFFSIIYSRHVVTTHEPFDKHLTGVHLHSFCFHFMSNIFSCFITYDLHALPPYIEQPFDPPPPPYPHLVSLLSSQNVICNVCVLMTEI